MNKRKTTKKSFIIAAVSFMLTVLLMMGATFAWFTASRTSGANTVKTADFNVTLQYSDDFSTWTDLTDASVLFDNVTLAPGEKSAIMYLRIENANSYDVTGEMTIGDIEVDPELIADTDKLKLYSSDVTSAISGDTATNDFWAGTSTALYGSTPISLFNGNIAAKSGTTNGSKIVAIGVELPTTATTPNVTAKFKITLAATQAHS